MLEVGRLFFRVLARGPEQSRWQAGLEEGPAWWEMSVLLVPPPGPPVPGTRPGSRGAGLGLCPSLSLTGVGHTGLSQGKPRRLG